MLAQSGFPVPAAAGTRLPLFRSIRTEIGDAQAILSDRSTFSSSMETLAGILSESGPGSLALIDEIGAATDPEEGSALAVAFLEAYLARGGRVIVSTHLTAVKSFAAAREDALSAAMEFDEASGRPNYRIHPGLSGRSRALSVAREQGLPGEVLERAREILGEAWRRRERAETEAEAALERLRGLEQEAERERDRARQETARLEAERKAYQHRRKRLLEEGLEGFERARAKLSRRVEEELAALRGEPARVAQASAERVLEPGLREAAAEEAVIEAREAALAETRELLPGDTIRLRGVSTEGRLVSIEEEAAWIEVAGKRIRVRREALQSSEPPAGDRGRRTGAITTPQPAVSAPTREVNVIGQRLDGALEEVEKALDEALLAGSPRVRIVHGHGTGRLREGIREHLRRHPAVASLRAAEPREGGNGATVVELK
jgi:DNA mismatch repair protein MutS2